MRQQLPMNTIYILIIIAITLVTNASLSFAMPFMKTKINAFISATKRKLNTPKPVNCVALEQRVKELEKKVNKRESNYRQAIRQEITSILIELKK
jgi:hypothetical protein